MATPHAPRAESLAAARRSFRRWRRLRPFWGGLFLILASIELFLSSNLDLGNLELHLGPQGFLSYVIPVMLLLCGILVWATPANRAFYGIIGLLVTTYSFVGLNFGGFLVGLLLGILGGALTLAWSPARTAPATAGSPQGASNGDADGPGAGTGSDTDPDDGAWPPADDGHTDNGRIDEGRTGPVPHQGTPTQIRQATVDPDSTAVLPRLGPDGSPAPGGGTSYRRILAISLAPTMLAAIGLAQAAQTPAQAAPCPVPGITTPTSSGPAGSKSAGKRTVKPTPTKKAAKPAATNGAAKPAAPGSAGTPPKAGPGAPAAKPQGADTTGGDAQAAPAPSEAGNPISQGWHDFVDGIQRVLSGGPLVPPDDPAPNVPAPDDPAPDDPAPNDPAPNDPAPGGGSGPGTPSTPGPKPTVAPKPTAGPGTGTGGTPTAPSGTASPTPSSSDLPCLGPRVFKVAEADGGLPDSALRPGILTGKSLNMFDPVYEGVAELQTSSGVVRALEFTMSEAVTEPFRLEIAEAGGNKTVITSSKLTIARKNKDSKDVRFYTTRFTGKFSGVVPMVFTPDQPPPLTLPWMWFTDVKIELALVQCEKLTASKLAINLA